jgi:hypothetical protein
VHAPPLPSPLPLPLPLPSMPRPRPRRQPPRPERHAPDRAQRQRCAAIPWSPLHAQIQAAIDARQLIPCGSHILVAVSGGQVRACAWRWCTMCSTRPSSSTAT